MCVTFFSYDQHESLLFLLGFNRDEFFDREAVPLHFWGDVPGMLASRDLKGNGTWLGMGKNGRFACVTNYRGLDSLQGAISSRVRRRRGDLPVSFVSTSSSPMDFLKDVHPAHYSPFSILVGDLQPEEPQIAYMCSHEDTAPIELPPGIHGFSNGHMADEWPKVKKGKEELEKLLRAADSDISDYSLPWEDIFSRVLGDDDKVEDEKLLPRTSWPLESEYDLSSTKITPFLAKAGSFGRHEGPLKCGTRSHTVLAVWRDGFVEARERALYPIDSDQWVETRESFVLELE